MWPKEVLNRLHPRLQGFLLGIAAAVFVGLVWSWLLPSYRYETLTFQRNGFTRQHVVRIHEGDGTAEFIADSYPGMPTGPELINVVSK